MKNETLSDGDKRNYEVFVGWQTKPLVLDANRGRRLTDLLSSDPTPFATLTLVDGKVITLRTGTITRVTRQEATSDIYKTPDELGLAESVDRAEGDGYKRFQELRRKVNKSL